MAQVITEQLFSEFLRVGQVAVKPPVVAAGRNTAAVARITAQTERQAINVRQSLRGSPNACARVAAASLAASASYDRLHCSIRLG